MWQPCLLASPASAVKRGAFWRRDGKMGTRDVAGYHGVHERRLRWSGRELLACRPRRVCMIDLWVSLILKKAFF